jgi:GGDEF domain-containing protein
MASRSSKRRRTSEAQERFRDAFLDQAGDQLVELAGLVEGADGDTLTMAAAELERLADTAGTLGLGHLERASRSAAHDLEQGRRMESLRLVAQALRRTRGRPRIGPILVVASPSDTQHLQGQLAAVTEHIRLFPDLESFTRAIHCDEPSAVVMPAESLEAVKQLSEYEDFPILVHGPLGAHEACAAALGHGAAGYLSRPLSLSELTRQVRWRAARPEDAEVFVLMDPGPTRDALVRAVESLGLGTVATGNPSDLGTALSGGHADAIVMGAEVQGVPCASLAALVRGHATHGHLPLMILGRPKQPQSLRSAGIDDLMRDNADPTHIAQRVRDRVRRFMSLPWMHQPASRLYTRLGALDALDVMLRSIQRQPATVAVALLQIDGLYVLPPHEHRRAVRHVRRMVAQTTAELLRRDDIVGELIPGAFVISMPQADADAARERLGAVRKALREQLRNQPNLKGLSPRLGVADTRMGIAGVVRRAERDLAG